MESDKTIYESYVYRHYRHLMTSDERLADRHLIGTAAENQSSSDTAPKSDRLVHAECRPPQGWAESFLFFSLKATTDALGASQN